MRLDVTPLGAASRSAAAVARAVVDYLEGGLGDPGAGLLSAGGGSAQYYGDSPEGPGRWVGAGAAFQRLSGTVERDAFQRLLEGRHPHTGARLITARGSSQRGHLAVGAAARFDALGQPLYDVADAAALLGLSKRDVDDMIETTNPATVDDRDRSALSTVEIDGETFVPDSEITRRLELAATPPTLADVLAGGGDDLLSVTQAAELLGVSAQYVRRLSARSGQADDFGEGVGDEPRLARLTAVKRDGVYLIRRHDLAEFAGQRKPPVARVGYDLTLTVEKSFGLLMLLAPEQVSRRFVAAFDVANTTAIDYLDRHAAAARRRGQVVSTEGLVGASYFHATSRALDPHPHRHNVIANAVVDDEGDIRALDARALYRAGPAAAALATAAARWELRDLGLGWWQRDNGIWEIAGVDEAAIEEFSLRHRKIGEIKAALARQLGRPVTRPEDGRIWADTRDDKTAVDPIELQASWRDRADRVGLDVAACFDRADRAIAYDTLPSDRVAVLFADLADREHGVCAGVDRFTRGDVIAAIVDWSVVDLNGQTRKVLLPVTEVETLADRFLACEQVIALDPALGRGVIRRGDGRVVGDGQVERRYTTVELLTVQQGLLSAWGRGTGAGRGVVGEDTLTAVLAEHPTLSDEQQQLVRAWCTSGDVAQAAVGRAGTGKTSTMRAAAAAWRAAGYRVIGAAVKGEAARRLADDAAIDADTVALLLSRARADPTIIDSRTVVIVDESSTLGDRDLAELLERVETAGATLRTIGDPAQHKSVPTGGCWAYLVTRNPTHELRAMHRLRDAGERHRADEVRSGRIRVALDELVASGQLELCDRDSDTYAKMLTRWLDARDAGHVHPMVHGRNRERRILNRLAQGLLIDAGEVDPDQAVTTGDGRTLCLGDEVIARHGDRRIYPHGKPEAWMRNGTAGTITAIRHGDGDDADRIEIATTTGETLICGRNVFDRRRGGIDLRYAVTSYAIQGQTRDLSTSAITASTTRSELYVDITRGRDSNKVYATRRIRATDDDRDRWLPTLERHLVDDLANRLARGNGDPVAVADPIAAHLATSGRRRTLAALHAARAAGHDVLSGEIERATAAVRATARPPQQLTWILPDAPIAPHLRRRIDDLAADAAVHHATHNPTRRPPRTLLERILGSRPTNPTAAASWARLADTLVTVVADAHIAAHARRTGPTVTAHDDAFRRNLRDLLDTTVESASPGLIAQAISTIAAGNTPAPLAPRRRTPTFELT